MNFNSKTAYAVVVVAVKCDGGRQVRLLHVEMRRREGLDLFPYYAGVRLSGRCVSCF